MLKATWLILICTAWPLAIAALNWSTKGDTSYLAEVTLLIAREYLSKSTSTIVVTERSFEPETINFNIRLLDKLLLNLQGTIAVQLYINTYRVQPWEYYIFIVDSLDAFR